MLTEHFFLFSKAENFEAAEVEIKVCLRPVLFTMIDKTSQELSERVMRENSKSAD